MLYTLWHLILTDIRVTVFMKLLNILPIGLSFMLAPTGFTQTPAAPKAPMQKKAAGPAAPAGMTVDDVVKLVQAKLSDDLIIGQLKKNGKAFSLSTDDLVKLKTSGASDNVLLVMMDPTATPAAPPPPPPPVVAKRIVDPPPAKEIERPKSQAEAELPKAFGVYYLLNDKWVQMSQTQCNVQRNKMRAILGGPLIRQKVHANIPGNWASLRIMDIEKPKFLAYFPDRKVSTFNLLRLAQKGEVREVAQLSVLYSSEQHEDKIEIDISPAGTANMFLLIPKGTLTPGEYAIVEPPPLSNTEKIAIMDVWDFGLGEKSNPGQAPAATPPAKQ